MLGKPGDGVDVEVVGGLVEHENIPIADEQAGQIDATPLAAREFADGSVPGDIAEKGRDDLADGAIGSPRVFGCVSYGGVLDAVFVSEVVRLRQPAYGSTAPADHFARIGLKRSSEQRKERRFAIAVLADDTNAVARVHAERDGVEHALCREFELNVFCCDEYCHGHPFLEHL